MEDFSPIHTEFASLKAAIATLEKKVVAATSKANSSRFGIGDIPTISCWNIATVPLGVDFSALIVALQVYVDTYVAPVWGTPCVLKQTTGPVAGTWSMIFMDNADVSGALAYHDLVSGMPISKVFVKTTLDDGELVSVSASHELVEMLVDPDCALMSVGPDQKTMYAYESADPVEAQTFLVNGIAMSNFVYPSYFESFRKAGSIKFDAMGKLKKPFELASGGYQIVFRSGRWTQVFGSKAKQDKFAKEDRRGHRSGRRSEQEPA